MVVVDCCLQIMVGGGRRQKQVSDFWRALVHDINDGWGGALGYFSTLRRKEAVLDIAFYKQHGI